MKRVFFAFVVASVLVFSACTTKGTESETSTVDTTVVSVDTFTTAVTDTATLDTTVTK